MTEFTAVSYGSKRFYNIKHRSTLLVGQSSLLLFAAASGQDHFVLDGGSEFVGGVEEQDGRDDDQDDVEEDGVDEGPEEGAARPVVGDPGVAEVQQQADDDAHDDEDDARNGSRVVSVKVRKSGHSYLTIGKKEKKSLRKGVVCCNFEKKIRTNRVSSKKS